MKKMNNKGFSLVELIVVIAIMAVLVGVLAPTLIKNVEKSRESTDLQNVEEIKTAIETFVAEYSEKFDDEAANPTVAVPSSGDITVTVPSVDDHDLTEYGIDTVSLKSSRWTAFTWTYDLEKYTWSVDEEAGAQYYDVYGEAK